jgi:Cys-rich repeat protein
MRPGHWKLASLLPLVGLGLAFGACRDLSLDLRFPDAAPALTADGGPTAPPVVHCSTQAQCVDAGASLCNVDAGTCVQCLSNADCSGSTPHCLAGKCVSCTTDADCSSGMVCNMHIPRCATQCTSGGAQCNGRPCATDYGYCVECLQNLDCTNASLPYCYEPPAIGLCVQCLTNADCKGNQFCGPTQRCASP